jgi:hypothetical protein
MNTRYMPVDPDYYEMIEKERTEKEISVIHYFKNEKSLGEEKGKIKGITTNHRNEDIVSLENGKGIRIDRIIVINGKPGPAYDEYDSYALACLDCMGGMD